MRIKVWNRLLIALSGLMILFIAVGVFVFGVGLFPFKLDVSALNEPMLLWQRIVIVAGSLLLVCLGIHDVWVLCHRKTDKGFVIQHTEFGDMSISLSALENMVKKCVDSHEMLTVNSTKIHRGHEGIVVDLKLTLFSGVNIPLTVNALQKQIKQYITSCSGVDVQEVRVMVETNPSVLSDSKEERCFDSVPAAPVAPEAPDMPTVEEGTAYKANQSFASRMFKHTEEPTSYSEASNQSETVDHENECSSASAVTDDAIANSEPLEEEKPTMENNATAKLEEADN
ncbi:MAG: alkaline shock response membrane anchor protein AmaP [Clostridia bacterium]